MRQLEFGFVRREAPWWVKRNRVIGTPVKVATFPIKDVKKWPSPFLVPKAPKQKTTPYVPNFGIILEITGEFLEKYEIAPLEVAYKFLKNPPPSFLNQVNVTILDHPTKDALLVKILSKEGCVGLYVLAEGMEMVKHCIGTHTDVS